MRRISVIIPTLNDLALGILATSLTQLCRIKNLEITCVDGGSTDGTLALIQSYPVKLINCASYCRAQRMNAGIACATGDVLFFHHPRSIIDTAALTYLQTAPEIPLWGGLQHRFDWTHPLLRFTSWYSNRMRAQRRGIVYLDHCIFVSRTLLKRIATPAWPEIDIFEDTAFSLKLRALVFPQLLPFVAITSAVRFKTRGLYRQALVNQVLKVAYALGLSKTSLNRYYEKNMGLNLPPHASDQRASRKLK